jgi:glutamate 5-kinase
MLCLYDKLSPIMQNRNYARIVLKFGTSTLTAGGTKLSPPRLVELVRQVASLIQQGREVVVVSSGAMAAGRERLNYPQLPKDVPAKQMLAAIGQPRLMSLYEQLFGLYGLNVAQVLLTRTDLADRRRYLNSRNTLQALLAQKVVPIINENDTVTTEEIRFGDNDRLSAYVVSLVDADLLVLLTDQDGLYTADPRTNPNAELVSMVTEPEISADLWQAAGGSANGLGTGGMSTKLQAADLARRSGATAIIAPGGQADILLRLVAGEPLGTQFPPLVSSLDSRHRYILAGGRMDWQVTVDRGAARALKKGGSLLPVGVSQISGEFDRGDAVRIVDETGKDLARGLVNYSANELGRILGQRSEAIEPILGYFFGEEVVHRNNMVLM